MWRIDDVPLRAFLVHHHPAPVPLEKDIWYINQFLGLLGVNMFALVPATNLVDVTNLVDATTTIDVYLLR